MTDNIFTKLIVDLFNSKDIQYTTILKTALLCPVVRTDINKRCFFGINCPLCHLTNTETHKCSSLICKYGDKCKKINSGNCRYAHLSSDNISKIMAFVDVRVITDDKNLIGKAYKTMMTSINEQAGLYRQFGMIKLNENKKINKNYKNNKSNDEEKTDEEKSYKYKKNKLESEEVPKKDEKTIKTHTKKNKHDAEGLEELEETEEDEVQEKRRKFKSYYKKQIKLIKIEKPELTEDECNDFILTEWNKLNQ